MGQNTQVAARTPASDAQAVLTDGDAPRDYSEPERVVTCMLATLVGVAEAARQRDIPASTIYKWMAKLGGAAALRNAASDVLATTEFVVGIEACQQLRKKMADMNVKQLLDTLRLVRATGARSPTEGLNGDGTAPGPPVAVQFNIGSASNPELVTIAPRDPAKTQGS